MTDELNETGVQLMASLARENLTGADCLYWTCELCGVTPGINCRTATGSIVPALLSHKSRREQSGRWQRWHVDHPDDGYAEWAQWADRQADKRLGAGGGLDRE